MVTLLQKLTAWSASYRLVLAGHPIATSLYLATTALLALATLIAFYRGRFNLAFWCTVAIIVVNIFCSPSEDLPLHYYRTIVIAEQLRHGSLSLLVTDGSAGDSLQLFTFYSFAPYLPSVALNLVGFPALVALNISLAAAFLVLALGLSRLADGIPRGPGAVLPVRQRYLAAILFITANYVVGLWTQRGALAELWIYALIPWVVTSMRSPERQWRLTALLFLQLCIHPVVFGQAFVAELAVAIGLSCGRTAPLQRRCAIASAIAILFSAPFWLPPFLLKDSILGFGALPVNFRDSFLHLGELLSRRHMLSLGLCLPLAIAVVAIGFRQPTGWRFWTLVATFASVMLVQTIYLRPVIERLPFLHYSTYIWRLMLPAALIGFGALLLSGPAKVAAMNSVLAGIALLSIANTLIVFYGTAPAGITYYVSAPDDASELRDYARANEVFGRREFMPNYSRLLERCENNAETAPYSNVLRGLVASRPFLRIRNGPVGPVTYSVDGLRIQPAKCGDDLVLGPLPSGATVKASEDALDGLLAARIACLALGLIALVFQVRPSSTKYAGPKEARPEPKT